MSVISRWVQVRAREIALFLVLLGLVLIIAGCQSMVNAASMQPASPLVTPDAARAPESPPAAADNYLLFNQRMVEALTGPVLDLTDVDAVFAHVFAGLPDEVIVYPSENYYYFVLYVGGQQIWGNIRLPAGDREEGLLSFGYFEFVEFPLRAGTGMSGSKFYGAADGVDVEELDPFTYLVRADGKEVIFNLHQLPQTPPTLFDLGEDEVFVERTFDESGYQFFLIFNQPGNYFFWVLNEEEPLPDLLESMADDLLAGKRSGFAFWVDEAHDNRKVLMAIRKLSVTRNDYHDGPFDQLADNYAAETDVSEYMQRAYPALRGRIDQYGYYTDRERPMRVALSTYFTYFAQSDMLRIAELVREADDPYELISKRGVIPTPTPTP